MLQMFRAARLCFSGFASAVLLVSYAAAGPQLSTIYAFTDQADGKTPAIWATDRAGNLYGTTGLGGEGTTCAGGGCGTVFKISPNGTKTVLHTFTDAPDGSEPSGLIVTGDGTIFGTTTDAGRYGFGTVFKLTPDGRETILHSFKLRNNKSPHGIWPLAGLTAGGDGTMYGTTWYGGINNHCGEGGCGTVFKITPKGRLSTIYAFAGGDDACHPSGGLALDRAGNLYGTNTGCGAGNSGTVYKVDPAGKEIVLHSFDGKGEGGGPQSTPIIDDAGNLYGGTVYGGSGCAPQGGCGVIYKIAPDGTETVLHSFQTMKDGYEVTGALVRDRAGNLFGTTYSGGAVLQCNTPYGCGTIFKLSPDGVKTTLYEFLGPDHGDGSGLYYGLIQGQGRYRHLFYSTAAIGPGCCGEVFSIAK